MVEAPKTVLTKAHSKTESLRITVPTCICRQLELKEGDTISWKIGAKSDQLTLCINPMKKESHK